MQKIADGVWIETTLRGVTVGAFETAEGFVLVDTPSFPADANQWRMMLQEIADLPIRAILLLDSHRDRILGASWFQPELLIAHSESREAVVSLSNSYVSTIANLLATNNAEQTSLLSGRILKPTVTFSDRMRLYFGDVELQLIHRPGPLQGTIWVYGAQQDVLFVGDSVMTGKPPYLSSPYSKAWIEALQSLDIEFPTSTLISGRQGITERGAIPPLLQYLHLARERVQHLYETRRPHSETTRLIHELLGIYPPPLEFELEEIQQRVRTGLQFIYNEFREDDLGRFEEREQVVAADDEE